MHPMERLRSVARATGAGPGVLVQEAAGALTALGDDPAGLVTACRRLVARHPAVGPMWWLCSRVLCAADPMAEAWRAAAEMEADATPAVLCGAVPDEASVVVLGWPDQVVDGLRRRGDVEILLVSGGGEAAGLGRRLRAVDVLVEEVPDAGLGAAAAEADLVVLEASVVGPEWFVATPGSRAAAAVARSTGRPVWLVAGVGRVVPARMWRAVESSLGASALPVWERDHELVPLSLCDQVVRPTGLWTPDDEDDEAPCPVAPELLRTAL